MIRNTKQRQLIFELVKNNFTHPTADEIYEKARLEDSRISRGTVYRNLNLLTQEGELLRISVPDGPDRFDFNTRRHYHFICRACKRVNDAPGLTSNPIEEMGEISQKLEGYKLEGFELYLTGLCPACNEKSLL